MFTLKPMLQAILGTSLAGAVYGILFGGCAALVVLVSGEWIMPLWAFVGAFIGTLTFVAADGVLGNLFGYNSPEGIPSRYVVLFTTVGSAFAISLFGWPGYIAAALIGVLGALMFQACKKADAKVEALEHRSDLMFSDDVEPSIPL